jgi:hypothetical protein
VTQVVQCLPSKHEVLNSIPITARKKEKKNISAGLNPSHPHPVYSMGEEGVISLVHPRVTFLESMVAVPANNRPIWLLSTLWHMAALN